MESLIGKRFGKLTVIERTENYIAPSKKYQLSQWKCICDCGKETVVTGSNLKRGNTTSCGCEAIKTRSLNGKKNKKLNTYSFKGDYVIGIDGNNNSFVFDTDDFDRVSKHCWNVNLSTGYVTTNIKRKHVILSRYIMRVSDEKILIDHRNHILTDNRKSNLRYASKSENCRNSKPQSNNTSGIPGVSLNKKSNKWVAYIYVNNIRKHLGTFTNKEDAITARMKAENEYFQDFSYLNSIGGSNVGE